MPLTISNPLLPPKTWAILHPDYVEFRSSANGGLLVVRVWSPSASDPRLSAVTDLLGRLYPAALGLSVIQAYVDEARRHSSHEATPPKL